MPAFASILLSLLPYLPDLVRFVESIHPPSAENAKKLDTAVGLVTTVIPEVVQHLAAEPANLGKLQSLIGTTVAGLNAANNWNLQRQSLPAPTAVPAPTPSSG